MNKATQNVSDPYQVNSLKNLENASPVEGDVVWDPLRSIWNATMLIGALVLAPIYFSWGAVAVFLLLSAITLCFGHSVGFHRRLIHRTFECSLWLERVLVWFGIAVGMGGPLWTIRLHDSRDWAQRHKECHPLFRHEYSLWRDGLLYLHCKLILKNPPTFNPGPGISDDWFYKFLDRSWMLHQIPIAAIVFYLGGMPWVVWGIFVRVTACTTLHWYISYVAHSKGGQDWVVDEAGVQGFNVPILAIFTMGESWHNNHHAFPGSACHGLYPGQIDPGWYFVKFLAALGLIWNVKLPANLPPRMGITPITDRALTIAAPGQADIVQNAGSR